MNNETENTDPPEIAEPEKKRAAKPKAAAATTPPCPDAEPSMGDKTPAVIAWWFKHHPEEAAAKYEGRKFQPPTDRE